MDNLRQTLTTILIQVQHFQATVIALTPERGQLRWLGGRRQRPALRLVFRDARDVLNHAATLIGYFDGYDARGAYQEGIALALPVPDSDQLTALLVYLHAVLVALERVLIDLIARESLALAASGPRKPGPKRTLQMCAMHLAHIEEKICTMVLNLASSKALQRRAQSRLDQN